jgi:hypothetical protein
VGERRGVLSLLEVETSGAEALFELLTTTLFALRVQIVRAESRLADAGRALRLWLVEFDGAPIGRARRLEIQVEVLRAVEQVQRRATSVQSHQPIVTIDKF